MKYCMDDTAFWIIETNRYFFSKKRSVTNEEAKEVNLSN